MTLLASIPSPSSGELEVGPLTLHAYGFTLLVAIVAATTLTGILWTRRGGDWDLVFRAAMWGVATTCGSFVRRPSGGGSVSKTSSPAPATCPRSIASASAASSMSSPRAVLMMRMPGLQSASRRASSKWRVSGVDGTWRVR